MVFIFQALGQRIHKAEYSEMMKTEPGYARCPLRTCPVAKKLDRLCLCTTVPFKCPPVAI